MTTRNHSQLENKSPRTVAKKKVSNLPAAHVLVLSFLSVIEQSYLKKKLLITVSVEQETLINAKWKKVGLLPAKKR